MDDMLEYVRSGDIEGVRRLLEEGFDVNGLDPNGYPLLLYVIKNGGIEMVRLFLDYGANVNTTIPSSPLKYAIKSKDTDIALLLLRNGAKATPDDLVLAMERGYEYLVRVMVEKGIDVNEESSNRIYPLLFAVRVCDPSIVTLLLDYGANINVHDSVSGRTPLMVAASREKHEIVRLLLSRGVDVNSVDRDGNTALMVTMHVGIIRMLIDAGIDINARDHHGHTALVEAITDSQHDKVKLLLEMNVEVEGDTLLSMAVDPYMTEILLSHGARADTNDGGIALIDACRDNNLGTVRMLADAGADVNAVDMNGDTPLIHATRNGYSHILSYLLSNGAYIDTKGRGNKTALMNAIEEDKPYLARHLIDTGASLIARDNHGNNVLMVCMNTDHPSIYIIDILLDAGMSPDTQNHDGTTPLMRAAASKNSYILEKLISRGASLNIRDNDGNTALMIASRLGIIENVRILLENGAHTSITNSNGHTAYTMARDPTIKNMIIKYSSSLMSSGRARGEYLDISL